jgi:hypothetical protein
MEYYTEVKNDIDKYEDYIVIGVILFLVCCVCSILMKIYDCVCCLPKCIVRCCKTNNYNRLDGI